MIVYLLLLIAICLTVTGEILLKLGMNAVRADVGAFSASLPVLLRTFTDWRVVLGFALIFSGALFWLGVISRADFSFAYPLLALSYVVALVPAWLVLGPRKIYSNLPVDLQTEYAGPLPDPQN